MKWRGPYVDGITSTLINRFLVCRHRFYLRVIKGFREVETKMPIALEYGNMWHECEEAWAAGRSVSAYLNKYCRKLGHRYPEERAEISRWKTICLLQFKQYCDYWGGEEYNYLMHEEDFCIDYPLPAMNSEGKTSVKLRGKFDAVFADESGLWLQENKTKGEKHIHQIGLAYGLPYNLQSMLYLVALHMMRNDPNNKLADYGEVQGTLYNVVKRPFSQWYPPKQRKGRMVKGKRVGAETDRTFLKRAVTEACRDNPEEWFIREEVIIRHKDLNRFCREMLNPILLQVCTWWQWIQQNPENPFGDDQTCHNNVFHYQQPMGNYNGMWDGWGGDFFEYITQGKTSKIEIAGTLFPELDYGNDDTKETKQKSTTKKKSRQRKTKPKKEKA